MKLDTISTLPPDNVQRETIEKELKQYGKKLAKWQEKLYAEGQRSILIVLQGMDTSGKSSTIGDVFKYVNPMGIDVKSYKKPTDEEFAHDFLWRVHKHAPAKGMIGIFDRSHYEDILIQRVHKWIDEDRVAQRMKHINNFEDLLVEENNTVVLKFYLHISNERQLRTLKERETNPEKLWKFNAADYEEREHWDAYMKAYEDVIEKCGKKHLWQVVPSDASWYRKYLVAKAVVEALEKMDPQYPTNK